MEVCCPSVESFSPIAGRESWLTGYPLISIIIYPNRFTLVTGKCVESSFVHPLYQWNVRAGEEQIICLCRWPHYWQLLANLQTDLLLLLTFNKDLAGIWEWCNQWCLMLNLNKTKAIVVSRSGTVNPTHVDLVLSGDYIRASPNLDILGIKFDTTLTFEDQVCGIVSCFSQWIGIWRLEKRIFVDTSVLLHFYYE